MSALKAKIYKQDGKEYGEIDLPEKVFGVKWNADLVHQVINSMLSSARRGTAHTKTRGEVSGGGKKPWRQKGTGRARHGSTRSPIWVGGGITHGPRADKNYFRKVNKKMKAKALFAILSRKLKDNEIVFLDDLSLSAPKTKEAKNIIASWKKIPEFEKGFSKNTAAITVPTQDANLTRGFRNFGNLSLEEFRNLNPVTLLKYKNLVIVNPEKSFEFFNRKIGGETKVEVAAKKTAKKRVKSS